MGVISVEFDSGCNPLGCFLLRQGDIINLIRNCVGRSVFNNSVHLIMSLISVSYIRSPVTKIVYTCRFIVHASQVGTEINKGSRSHGNSRM